MLTDLDRRIATEGTLYDWLRLAWPQVERTPFVDGWHIGAVCEHLQAVSELEIRDLIVSIPPGCTKSLLVHVFWHAWEWLRRPSTKFICASFDSSLPGKRDGGRLLALMQSPWWAARFPNLLASRHASAGNFDILGGGFRFATSPGGRGTGRHGNIVSVDDPINPRGATSAEKLRTVSEWWGGTMSTRQADPSTHRTVVVMQRLHGADLSGELLAKGGYQELRLPMRYEKAYSCPGDKRTEDGELLWPERFPAKVVEDLQRVLGPTQTAAQHQQRPTALGGSMFRRSWWRFWHTEEDRPEPCMCDDAWQGHPCEHVTPVCAVLPAVGWDVESWDMAFKGEADSDFVAGTGWRAASGRFWLLYLLNERLDFADTVAAVLRSAASYPQVTTRLVEDKANGPAVTSILSQAVDGLTLVTPEGGKEARAYAIEPMLAEGCVVLPHPDLVPGVWALLRQAEAFPRGANDDLVDSLTQALIYLRATQPDLLSRAMAEVRKHAAR